jgi:hypothetical protein
MTGLRKDKRRLKETRKTGVKCRTPFTLWLLKGLFLGALARKSEALWEHLLIFLPLCISTLEPSTSQRRGESF